MNAEVSCPRCLSKLVPYLSQCPYCGTNLELVEFVEETYFSAKVNPMDIRIAPETLVPRLGDLLIERGLLGPKELDAALDYQQEKIMQGKPCLIGQALVELGFVDQNAIDEVVTIQIFQLQHNLERVNQELEQRVAERTAKLEDTLLKLTELNQLKSNFISNISHELRTPLTHIKGYLDIFTDQSLGPLTKMQEDALKVLIRSEDRLEQLIDDLIQFSTAVRGELSLTEQEIDIRHMVDAQLPQLIRKANAKDIKLEIMIPNGVPKIYADEDKIQWVINQLIDNGIKFTPKGGQVGISVEPEVDFVEIKVSDSGIGIPEERIAEIFEPFHQLDGSITRKYSGTGLGLAMVKRILDAHGSQLQVMSKIDRGSIFTFSLPVAAFDDDR
ncbi:MAG: hypothetical protein JSV42_10130 [Chloroflexota bacterium]|nr:MAG: hypothetical protein JSV42_10130 [Chloroflexota bacterium]